MSPRKLTEDDKKSMLELYRNSKATTSTLAEEFGVSSSTVSRFLKNSLSEAEYEELIQQKRLARTPKGGLVSAEADLNQLEIPSQELKTDSKPSQKIILSPKTTQVEPKTEPSEAVVTVTSSSSVPRRKNSAIASEMVQSRIEDSFPETSLEIKPSSTVKLQKKFPSESLEVEIDEEDVNVVALSAMLGEEIDDLEDIEDDEDDDDDEDDEDDERLDFPHTTATNKDLEILPLATASLPRTCYLVVDRAAELIVKPLQEFADLGTIPEEEIQQKTLPVFDNHRIAKRFSHRREKVIKVPDGKMLQKTSPYLYEKGITRLLIRGQIYAISEN
jgi:transposase-like protein